MNSTDPWAKRLASWTPRPPSPELEARIFGTRTGVADSRPALGPSTVARWVGWGVPSLGTAFLVASLWVHPVPPINTLSGVQAAQLAALSSAAAQSSQNALPVRSFAWTNSAQPRSTNGSWGGLN